MVGGASLPPKMPSRTFLPSVQCMKQTRNSSKSLVFDLKRLDWLIEVAEKYHVMSTWGSKLKREVLEKLMFHCSHFDENILHHIHKVDDIRWSWQWVHLSLCCSWKASCQSYQFKKGSRQTLSVKSQFVRTQTHLNSRRLLVIVLA